MKTGHVSYYINVGQTLGVIGLFALGWKALKIEEAKAGLQNRSVIDILHDDAIRLQDWYNRNVSHQTYRYH